MANILRTFGNVASTIAGSVNRSQTSVDRGIISAEDTGITDGQLVSASLAASSASLVSHSLGRVPSGVIVVSITATGTFPRFIIPSASFTARDISITADTACSVYLWVF